ncbi:two-component system histidine kinase PnpS [Thermosyntropha sp.]|uniref:two-component system histidine kinase PnpS n=1 Tax=Thermosyntropha sp. TaxID=2740820 RepID=UPI0025F12AB1|nr:ATP-binding protein [Thermosyntropha sp.]MBO8158604.1 HAMP domain-containing protein [Thermosyntropha sp.]
MLNSIRSRLIATYLAVIVLILAVSGVILSLTFRTYYIENVQSNLTYEAVLISEMFSFYQLEKDNFDVFLKEVVARAAKDTEARITVIAEDGKVLADSRFEEKEMESHADRPEVVKALKDGKGYDIRLSGTARIQMVYAAVPFASGDVKGVIRLSKPLIEVKILYKNLLSVLFLSIALTGMAVFILSIGIARRFSAPISEITETVRDIACGDLKRRVLHKSDDELGVLAEAINNMTVYLEKTITEISEVKNRFEAVLNNTINGILMFDSEGRIAYANPVARLIFGFKDDFIGRKGVEVIENYELVRMLDEAKNRLAPVRKSVNFYSRGEKILEVNVIPVMESENSSLDSILVVCNDITELKRLEQIRQDFVANVSHELKTPVAAISGFAETLMEEKGENSDNVEEFSRIIYEEAKRLKKMIEELLELSRIESGKMPTSFLPTDIVKIAWEAVDIIKQRFPERSEDIVLRSEERNLVVEADEEQIMRIILNLMENAVYYSPAGTPITLSISRENEYVRIEVKDEGEGIPEKEIPRLFERFYRVDKARSRKTGGTGLGLAIVKHLVENHRGMVKVRSRLGAGSVFSVVLPLKQS